ncbi:hypothetical protein [Paenibacillus sp. FSL P4-0288]|uniref:hypothetical protein n=1 Tax=Paenibacillus sp. FSL P4-0288 TaxID=2921633 RepID=UPI0030F60B7E
MHKEWLDLDDEIDQIRYSNEYIYLSLGINSVNPLNVIALSRELDQDKLEKVRSLVIKDGWLNLDPRNAVRLLLMPNGSYVVDGRGNHRVYVCNERGIDNIRAKVGTYMKKDCLTNEELDKHENYKAELSLLAKKIRRENNEELKAEYEDQQADLIKNHKDWLLQIYYEKFD